MKSPIRGVFILVLVGAAWWLFAPKELTQDARSAHGLPDRPFSQGARPATPQTDSATTSETTTPSDVQEHLPAMRDGRDGKSSPAEIPGSVNAAQSREAAEFKRWQDLLQAHQGTTAKGSATEPLARSSAQGTPHAKPSQLVCEPNQHGAALVHRPIPFGFIFDPQDYAGGRVELRNLQDEHLIMSVNGNDGVMVNGLPAIPGANYPIDGSVEVSAPGPVRIHVRPGTAPGQTVGGAG